MMATSRKSPRQRYNALSNYLRLRYRVPVHKIPLDAGLGCPNRGGSTGRAAGGCIYCDNSAFSPFSSDAPPALEEQLRQGIASARHKHRARAFIAYFQAYTNTFAPYETLRERFDLIRSFPEIVGLNVGTRPDCVPDETLELLDAYCDDYEVWVEYGLQSAHNATLDLIQRGHTVEDFIDATERTARTRVLVCVHVILGLPGEAPDQMMETARLLARLPVHGVKIHHCHVVGGTPLAEMYHRGGYRPLDCDSYVSLVCDFLEHLPWPVTIHRLVGETQGGLLIAPLWTQAKGTILQNIRNELHRRNTHQGFRYTRRAV